MSFGLKTYNADGTVALTQDKKLCRLAATIIAPAGNNGSQYVGGRC